MNGRARNAKPEFTLAQLKQARKRLDPHVVSLTAPDSYEAEQYRKLRYALEQRHTGSCLVTAITSPAPGDGKSLTAVNLAGALAQDMGARILLVDADLRRHSASMRQYLALGTVAVPGLVDAIANPDLSLHSVTRRIAPLNLSFVLTGAQHAAPYEILGSPRFGELMTEARRAYDYVIVDCPPVVPVSDCRVIMGWIDGCLLVVAANETPRGMLAEALELIGPDKVFGLIYNGGAELLSRYYGYGYRGYGRPARETSSERDSWLQGTEQMFGWKRRQSVRQTPVERGDG